MIICPNPNCAAPKGLCVKRADNELGQCTYWQEYAYSMSLEGTFRVMMDSDERIRRRKGCPESHPNSVPVGLVQLHRAQVEKNHDGQNVERVQRRGGLSAVEMYCVLKDMRLRDFDWDMNYKDIGQFLYREIDRFKCAAQSY